MKTANPTPHSIAVIPPMPALPQRQADPLFLPFAMSWLWLVLLVLINGNALRAQTCVPKPAGLVAWWPAAGNANDVQGTNNGTLVNGAAFAAGKVGQAFSLNGYVEVLHSTNLSFGPTTPMSFELWAYRTGGGVAQHLLGKRQGDSINYQLAFDSGDGVHFHSSSSHVSTGPAMPVGQWTHLAATFDGSFLTLYINGEPNASAAATLGAPNTAPLLIGGSGGYATFSGLVDEVSIYNRALTATEIQGIYVASSAGKCSVEFPGIYSQPTNQTVLSGSNVAFSVGAFGLSPGYYWYFNATNLLVGANNSMMLLTNVTFPHAGLYSVLVSNFLGSVLSSNAILTVLTPGMDDDSDGLLNETEIQLGTNPLKADTDGDGLSDFDEFFVYGTNPLKTDTDGDGMLDGWEMQHGLNPLVNDANDDLDLDGVSNLQEYQNRALAYRPDRADSRGDGRSDYERLYGTQTNRFYYDRTDRLAGADYNRGSNGFAIAYVYDGNGNLLRQKNLVRDANHNEMPDLWEFLNGLTNNTSAYSDSDGDGWSDYQEWQAGTNPRDAASRPGLLDNPGLNIASLTLPFTPSNFVVMTRG